MLKHVLLGAGADPGGGVTPSGTSRPPAEISPSDSNS